MTTFVDNDLRTAILGCLALSVPFAAWRMPGQKEINFFSDPEEIDGHNITPADSFLINHFNSTSSDNIRIALKLNLDNTLDYLKKASKVKQSDCVDVAIQLPATTSRQTYLEKVSNLIESLRKIPDGKVVIARTISGGNQNLNVVDVLSSLCRMYPDTFCYLFFHPATGCWTGATPELLIHTNRITNTFSTMALAGTMPASNSDWNAKNVREQKIVQRHIVESLNRAGASDVTESTKSLQYGNIQHLCTEYSGHLPFESTFALADLLSPTPAVCGTPKDYALKMISQVEDFTRECYAGYIAVSTPSTVTAMVNIRCARIDPSTGRYCIYVGSGITSGSTANDEWDETAMKASALLSVLSGG